MRSLDNPLGQWLACALAGTLVAYVYAVLRVEPAAHDASISAWHWFWRSYGPFFGRGLLLGGAVGLVVVWLVPRVARQRRSA